jgi:hypothetical protein
VYWRTLLPRGAISRPDESHTNSLGVTSKTVSAWRRAFIWFCLEESMQGVDTADSRVAATLEPPICAAVRIPHCNGIRDQDTIFLLAIGCEADIHDRPSSKGQTQCLPIQSNSFHKSGRVPCARTVPKPSEFALLGLALSEKQIPQVVGKIEKPN